MPSPHSPGELPTPEGYTLVSFIAEGACGGVWRASGPGGILCALKYVRLGGRAGELELRSIDRMKTIGHPHLIKIFGAWQMDGYLILAMELAERTLEQRLEEATAAARSVREPGYRGSGVGFRLAAVPSEE